VKFVPRIAPLREQLLGSDIERPSRGSVAQPVEVIGDGKQRIGVCRLLGIRRINPKGRGTS
jgi:hypothetical protein